MNAITTTTPDEAFRAEASILMAEAAVLTLHDLLIQFVNLTEVMDENCTKDEDSYRAKLNEVGEVASRKRRLVAGAARARFGISFEAYDRPSANSDGDW